MLPSGWLGKNHALQHGAKQAVGKLLLFADADIVMHPSAIKRAVYYMQKNILDHRVVGPQLKISGKMLKIALLTFSVNFMLFFQESLGGILTMHWMNLRNSNHESR